MTKLLALLIFLSGCTSYTKTKDVKYCIQSVMQEPSCGDSSIGWEKMSRLELMHWAEACGAESVAYCLGIEP